MSVETDVAAFTFHLFTPPLCFASLLLYCLSLYVVFVTTNRLYLVSTVDRRTGLRLRTTRRPPGSGLRSGPYCSS